MKKLREPKIITNWEDLTLEQQEAEVDCEEILMDAEVEDLEENTEKEKLFKTLQRQRLQQYKQTKKN
jgi:hypothetical protein